MADIIFLSPNVVQFTYEKGHLQEKDFCFENKTESNFLSSEISFLEKHISGFLDLLNLVDTGDVIYFTLPKVFNKASTVQFVHDLIAACSYNKPLCIIYDLSRFACKNNANYKSTEFCDALEQMFEDSNLPVLNLATIPKRQFDLDFIDPLNDDLFLFNEAGFNLSRLKKISNNIFELKNLVVSFQNTEEDYLSNFHLNPSLKYKYTLN